jgi:thiol-disulfide isomerase/thioredoxin
MNRRLFVSTLLASVALPLVAATSSPAAKPAKPLHVSMGAPVKLNDYLVPGKTVVFDFYSDYCGPCKVIAPKLEALHEKRADIIVVKVDINRPGVRGIDWKSPVAKQYGLNSIPHLKIYGPDGKLMAEDGEKGAKARELVMGWLEKT